MTRRPLAWTLAIFAALALSRAVAAAPTCVAGGCHRNLAGAKFVHGPVAAELAGGEGCVSCHIPAGQPCSASKAGKFSYKTKKERLCLLCHERGTATQHTRSRSDCLSCHDPHYSDLSDKLLRAGQIDKARRK